MSVPPLSQPPAGTVARLLATARGEFAVLDTPPVGPARGTVLLVPGFSGSKEDFLGILRPLGEAGFRVVGYDQRGQYQTAGSADPDAYTLEAMATDLLAVVGALGAESPHLVGHSFGGLVARVAVVAEPERFGSLTLMSSGPGPVEEPDQQRLGMLLAALEQYGLEQIWAALRAVEAAEGVAEISDPLIRDFMRVRFLANHPVSLGRIARHLLTGVELTAEVRKTGLPVHVLHGEQDHAWEPWRQGELAERLDAHRTVVAGAAHSPAAEQPAATAEALLEFWAAPR